ncbi:hypothetical protein KSS87_017796, partial [Heliosperma pusillum]
QVGDGSHPSSSLTQPALCTIGRGLDGVSPACGPYDRIIVPSLNPWPWSPFRSSLKLCFFCRINFENHPLKLSKFSVTMAMKSLPTRFLQRCSRNSLLRSHLRNSEASCQFPSLANTIIKRYSKSARGIQTQSEAYIQSTEVAEKAAVAPPKVGGLSELKADALKANSEMSIRSSVMPDLKVSSRHDLAMVFTCKVCETRSVKTCCRESYENGVVVVRCGGCNNLHLMADRLGWFGEPGSVEDLLNARGDDIKRGDVDSLNLTLEDLAGKKL